MHNSLFINNIMLHYYPRHDSSINMLCSLLSTGVLCSRLQRATIPDAEWIQFFLLKMAC